MTVRNEFDKQFYDHYYLSPSTAVVTPGDIVKLTRFVIAYLDYLGVPTRTMLDAGCGLGLWPRRGDEVETNHRLRRH